MKSLDELHAICEIIIAYELPREQLLFMNFKEKMETDLLLRNLGSSGVTSIKYNGTDLVCDKVTYGAVNFYIINTEYIDKEPHQHDWEESKTCFSGTSDVYILSRYCKNCGRTETYDGTSQRWVKTGYLKDCKNSNERP